MPPGPSQGRASRAHQRHTLTPSWTRRPGPSGVGGGSYSQKQRVARLAIWRTCRRIVGVETSTRRSPCHRAKRARILDTDPADLAAVVRLM
jgi:hypothetical protein